MSFYIWQLMAFLVVAIQLVPKLRNHGASIFLLKVFDLQKGWFVGLLVVRPFMKQTKKCQMMRCPRKEYHNMLENIAGNTSMLVGKAAEVMDWDMGRGWFFLSPPSGRGKQQCTLATGRWDRNMAHTTQPSSRCIKCLRICLQARVEV